MVNEIKSVLTLDDVDFKKKLTDNEKSVLKFSAAVATIGAAATAAAVSTAAWQDKTGKLAQSAGVSAVALSKMSIAANKSNVSQEELSQTLAKISSASPELATRLSKIGVSYTDAAGKAKTTSEVFGDIAEKVSKAGSTAQKTAIAVRAFGDEGAKLVPMLVGGKKALADAAAEAEKYGLIVSEQAAEAAAKFNDDLAESKNALVGLTSAIGESIIAWSNQGGVMNGVRNAIAFITQAWRGLDESAKNFIITAGAVAIAIGAIGAALIALKAMAPLVGQALTSMLGPVGIALMVTVTAVTAAITAYEDYAGTLDNMTTPALESMKSAGNSWLNIFKKFPQTAEEAAGSMDKTAASAGKIERPISIIGTIIAWVTKQFSKMALDWSTALEIVAIQIDSTVQKFKEVYAATKALISADMNAYQQAANRYADIDKNTSEIRSELLDRFAKKRKQIDDESVLRYAANSKKIEKIATESAGEVQQEGVATATYLNPVVTAYRNIELASLKAAGANAETLAKFARDTDEMQREVIDDLTATGIGYAKLAEAAVNSVPPAIQAASMVTDALAKSTQYASRVAARDLEVMSIRAQRAYEEQKASIETQSAQEIENINATYDAKISAVTMGEASITAAIEMERNKRLLADDAEYQAAVEALRLQFEAKRALIEQNSLDIEQRRLNDAVAEQSFQQQLANLASEFAGKKDKTNKDADAKATAQKKITDEQIKKLEAEKNAALELSKKTSDEKLKALDEKKAADDKALEKQKLQTQYDAEVQEFNQTKAVKSVQTIASGIASAAQAFAATAASLPFGLGIPIGLGIAATIMGATYASVNQINSQQPVKPAALIAAKGGTLTAGETHYGPSGGIDVKAERGETILSSALTDKLESTLESGSGSQNIYFQDGAIRVMELSREMVMEIARAVGDEVRREGFAI